MLFALTWSPWPTTDQLHEGVKPTLGELEKFQVTPEEMEQECESLSLAQSFLARARARARARVCVCVCVCMCLHS